jgi:hypothetical protein
MFKTYIEPDLRTAQLRIVNGFNPFAGFLSPTYILKSRVAGRSDGATNGDGSSSPHATPQEEEQEEEDAGLALLDAAAAEGGDGPASAALVDDGRGPPAPAPTPLQVEAALAAAAEVVVAGGGPRRPSLPGLSSPAKAPLAAPQVQAREQEIVDVYLLPPGEDAETCTSWLRS